ncbi:Upstream stimulatory factor 2 [Frankliniella fusca]|uniref:Upstream stimulatory factor 2 n=1 Tax=Frankliniella fusca TaxID=407009 RepID=A0AAE1HK87_9NEOP|nr:Upstream stimulatory factor 2 [Frankliniella fusca]
MIILSTLSTQRAQLGEHSLDVRQDTSLSDGNARKKLVQLLVVTDGQLQVTGDNSGLLVVTGSVSSKLKYLSCKIRHLAIPSLRPAENFPR